MAQVKITRAKLLAGIVLALLATAVIAPGALQSLGKKIGIGQEITGQEVTGGQQANEQQAAEEGEGGQAMPSYQLDSVYLYLKDKLDPKTGIPNAEVEVLPAPEARDTASLAAVASDPDRNVIDEDANSASDGEIALTAGRIYTSKDYLYSVRNETGIYDKLFVRSIKAPSKQFKISSVTFPENVLVSRVGAFSDAHTDADNVLDAAWNSKMNLTEQSGSVAVSTDITIGESEAGRILKEPVMVLRYPEGKEISAGGIESLVITRKTGTSFNVPAEDLVSYVDTETPVLLKDTMNVADSGTYTVKMTYDASIVEPGDELQISFDDMGDRRERDLASRALKAQTESVTFKWES